MTGKGEDALIKCCPIGCSSALENTPIRLAEGRLKRCPECGQLLSSCNRAWFDQSMREFNVPHGTLPEGANKVRYHQRMGKILSGARAIIDNDKQPLRLLDVGCSSGALLLVARQCGYDCFGAEPAAQAAATAQGLGFDVFPGYLQDAAYADDHFDVVTLFEVIEHLLAPDTLLREIRRILRPGGLLLIGTGNAESWTAAFLQDKWEYFDIRSHGGHISFFNPKSISLLGRKCGFNVHSIATRRVNLAERKDVSGALYQLVRIARELLAIPARWTNRGHDMLAILRKPGQ